MVERRAFEAHAIVGKSFHEGDQHRLLVGVQAHCVQIPAAVGRFGKVSSPGIELHHLLERRQSAVMHVRTGEFDIAQSGRLEDAGGPWKIASAQRDRRREWLAEVVNAAESDVLGRRPHVGSEEARIQPCLAGGSDAVYFADGCRAQFRAGVAQRALFATKLPLAGLLLRGHGGGLAFGEQIER